jgi:glycosyltransferase involved in cell wall biosynthesis
MSESRYRVLFVGTHPVQYGETPLRALTKNSKLKVVTAYCSLQGAEAAVDPEFGVEVQWDIPMLAGYSWVRVPNRSPWPGLGRFFGLVNPGLWNVIRRGYFDVVVFVTGYLYASFWIAFAAAKSKGVPVIFSIDAHDTASRDGKKWKSQIKKWGWPRFFKLMDGIITVSSGGIQLMRTMGVPSEKVVLAPYSVNNDWWTRESGSIDPTAVRKKWEIPMDALVVVFCAKLQSWKRPCDVLRAFAKAGVPGSFLVMAGEGPLRQHLEEEAQLLGIAERVRFLGFTNQSKLPAVYCSSDLLVLPSECEPFGLVVNEAMLCGCPVIVSDQVGARFDLVKEGKTGFVYPVGNVEALTAVLRQSLADPALLRQMGDAARERMKTWSPRESVEALARAINNAATFRKHKHS